MEEKTGNSTGELVSLLHPEALFLVHDCQAEVSESSRRARQHRVSRHQYVHLQATCARTKQTRAKNEHKSNNEKRKMIPGAIYTGNKW